MPIYNKRTKIFSGTPRTNMENMVCALDFLIFLMSFSRDIHHKGFFVCRARELRNMRVRLSVSRASKMSEATSQCIFAKIDPLFPGVTFLLIIFYFSPPHEWSDIVGHRTAQNHTKPQTSQNLMQTS